MPNYDSYMNNNKFEQQIESIVATGEINPIEEIEKEEKTEEVKETKKKTRKTKEEDK